MKIKLLFLFGFLLGLPTVQSQEYLDLIQNPNENTTLQEIQDLASTYFINSDKGRGSGYKQYKRWEYKMERMVNADGKLQNFSKLNWDVIASIDSENSSIERSTGAWTPLGPTSYTNGNSGYNGGLGRVNVIAFHPTDANTIYIGVPAGGLWKTTDGGSNWTPMSDALASLGVSGIAVDHSNPNVVYILTGDGDGGDTQSIGVMKSTDGGLTWATTGLSWNVTNFNRGYKLLMHPTNSSIMFAVTTVGILKTTDGWATWTNVQSGSFRDLEFKPGSPNTMYGSTTNTFYRSTNLGSSFSTISSGLPTGENRSELGVSAANSNYVYYLSGPSGSNSFKGLYRSTDSGLTFSAMATTPNILGYSTSGNDSSSQSWYDLAIAVNPTNASNTITGGVNLWRSTNGGATNTCITNWSEPSGSFEYVHADIHELVYNSVDNKLYCGSDGGISVSSDNGLNWTNIWNGLQIMQFYKIAGVENNQNLLVGGAQDNGSNKYTGTPNIQHIYGADGMDCMIDYNNNNNIYYSFQGGGLRRSTNGGSTGTNIKPSGSTGAWVTPYAMDATNPSIIYGGYSDVYRSTNMGSTWINLGSDGRGALAVGVNNPARLYAANGNNIQTSSNTGSSWTTITGPWPNLTITSIALDPLNADRLWITLGGYTSGQKVYESINAGSSWTNVSGSLPNSPALSIAYENTGGSPADAIYIGMSVGVYYKSDVTSWTLFNTGLPNVPNYDLEINHANSKLRAGTYGRGLWETDLFNNIDTTSPVAICKNITVQLNISGSVTINAIDVDDGSTDNIGIIDYSINVNSFDCNDLGANSVILTVTDAAGNSDNCTATVTVEDSIVPTAICQDLTVQLDANGNGSIVPSNVDNGSSDNCGVSSLALNIDTFDCNDIGANTVILTVDDGNGNSDTCTAIVTVEDNIAPTAICQDLTVQLDANGNGSIVPSDVDNGSSDNCGVSSLVLDIDTFDCNDIGANTVTLTIDDGNGNSDTCTAIVTVEDNIAPTAICQDFIVQLEANGNGSIVPSDVDNGSNDNCGVSSLVLDIDTFDCNDIGANTVILTVEDVNGNSATCTAIVTVEDNISPTVICQDLTVQLDTSGNGFIVPTDVDNGSSDNCGINSYSLNIDTFDCDDVGSNTVLLTVTDVGGNAESCSAVITVEDTVDPIAICQDITVVLDGNGNASITGDDINNGSSDACGIASLTVTPNNFNTGDLGDNPVVLTVTDVNGNSATCNAIVTVTDILSNENILTPENVTLFPNPSEDNIIITFPRELEVSIQLFDVVGKLIQSQTDVFVTETYSMDVSELNTGTYFVLINSEKGTFIKRIIKE